MRPHAAPGPQPTSVSNLVEALFFIQGYQLLLLALVVSAGRGALAPRAHTSLSAASAGAHPHARWALLLLFLAFAGLPPLFFFFPKLALLAALATRGARGVPLLALALVAAAWVAYFSALRQCLAPGLPATCTPRARQVGYHHCAALAALVLVAWFVGGAFFLGDTLLQCAWLSV